ncbi:FCD domain-containing protein [Amycolatopsis rhabdoformis]|uniref:FCD domain-containing protein n=1 Tax=Amycolatopsis rhabdoformis TaxID=1448059 RepID=A0ABZ1IN05_9PSEU|nr:FCD domain-containing protein [Amycolatopsis rhabdoformis]WSE35042.1 FCD domain-containing protein [Amycolatopsis rhabdoformis]
MNVRSVSRTSLVDAAVDELRRLIARGEWPVDTKLPGEVELARLLGVGRSTCREAVRVLAAAGQLRAHQGSGTYVASAEPVSELDRNLRAAAVIDVYEVRIGLEVEAARLAAARRTTADLHTLGEALRGRDEAATPEELVETDLALHAAVVAAAHNPVLTDLFAAFLASLREAAHQLVSDTGLGAAPDHHHDAHHALVAAIEAGDPAAAAAATREHLDATLEALRAHR